VTRLAVPSPADKVMLEYLLEHFLVEVTVPASLVPLDDHAWAGRAARASRSGSRTDVPAVTSTSGLPLGNSGLVPSMRSPWYATGRAAMRSAQHAVARHPQTAAGMAPVIRPSHPAEQHSVAGMQLLADHFQAGVIRPAERRQVVRAEGSVVRWRLACQARSCRVTW
jgi:hypothetical protein